jgi:hypothetical protein
MFTNIFVLIGGYLCITFELSKIQLELGKCLKNLIIGLKYLEPYMLTYIFK